MSLTQKIFIAIILGFSLGLLLHHYPTQWADYYVVNGIFKVMGQFLLKGLKLIVVPLIFCSLYTGIIQLADLQKLTRIGGKSFIFFVSTTIIAICSALIFVNILPVSFSVPSLENKDITVPALETPMDGWDFLIDIVPSNIFKVFVEAQILPLLFFTILISVATLLVFKDEEKKDTINAFTNSIDGAYLVIKKLIHIVMCYAPYGVFALMATLFAQQGITVFIPLIEYILLIALILIFHAITVYGGLLYVNGFNPIHVIKNMLPALSVAFSTSSSGATLPVTIDCLTSGLKVRKSEASLIASLGATMNMDGTAIMQTVATVFIASIYNIDLNLFHYFSILFMAVITSIGTPSVAGAGIITLSMILTQIGLPTEGIIYILSIDRMVNMLRTPINVFGDAVITLVIAKQEKAILPQEC